MTLPYNSGPPIPNTSNNEVLVDHAPESEDYIRKTTPTAPRKPRARKGALKLHSFLGISLAIYFVTMSISGTSQVFYHDLGELNVASSKTLSSPVHNEKKLSDHSALGQLIENAQAECPDGKVTWVHFRESKDKPIEIYVTNHDGKVTLLADPRSFEITGRQNAVLQFLRDLHFNLLSGKTGRTLNGVGALALLVLSCTGIMAWWSTPGSKQARTRFKSFDITRGAAGGADWLRAAHYATGFWLAPMLLVWGLSGIYLGFNDQIKAIFEKPGIETESNSIKTSPETDIESSKTTLSLGERLLRAEAVDPALSVRWVRVPSEPNAPMRVRLAQKETHFYGDMLEATITSDGNISTIIDPKDRSVTQSLIAVLEKLHFGLIAGDYSRFTWLLVGLSPAFLSLSGIAIWRSRKTNIKTRTARIPSWEHLKQSDSPAFKNGGSDR